MSKIALIFENRRWVGPENFFGDAYITPAGGLRIVFTISDNTLQNTCVEFEPAMRLTSNNTAMAVFRANTLQNAPHVTRFEEILERNKLWKKTFFYMAEIPNSYVLRDTQETS